ncbi:MAG TPA: hypothetical protein ENI51_09790 [Candidatus Atribacteria bacterium]|nr:hypothetical protein [Candidatus Atribacteria bacterium]
MDYEREVKNDKKFVFLLLILGIGLAVIASLLLYEGQKISYELRYIYEISSEMDNPFAGVETNTNSIVYMSSQNVPFYIRYSWELFFVIPAIFILTCAVFTLISVYFIHLKERLKLISIGLDFSVIGATFVAYLPLSLFTSRLWFIIEIELYQIYLLFLIELLTLGIIATIFISLLKKSKQRYLANHYN